MKTRFRTLSTQDTLDRATEELLAGSQQDFPVMDEGKVTGILRRNDLVKALSNGRRDAPVSEAMFRECHPVEASAMLTRTLETMRANQRATVPVAEEGKIVGLLTLENIGELVMVNAALAGNGTKPGADAQPNKAATGAAH